MIFGLLGLGVVVDYSFRFIMIFGLLVPGVVVVGVIANGDLVATKGLFGFCQLVALVLMSQAPFSAWKII
jgi:hypothetical protein